MKIERSEIPNAIGTKNQPLTPRFSGGDLLTLCFSRGNLIGVALIAMLLLPSLWEGPGMGLFAQNVGINTTGNTPKDAALLEVGEGAPDTKGLLIPRVNLTDVAVYAPLTGTAVTSLIVYSSTSPTNGNGPGYYYWSGTKWLNIPAPSNGPGTSGQALTSQGSGTPPVWSTLSVSGGGPTGCASCITSISTTEWVSVNWATCRENCRTLVEGGFSDWRMPTWDEAAYYGSGAFNPPDGSWIANWVWTSTPWDSRVAGTPSGGNWVIFYESVGSWTDGTYTGANTCRCVR